MKFAEALEKLKQGARIRRESWPADKLALCVPVVVDAEGRSSDGRLALDKPYVEIATKATAKAKGGMHQEKVSSLPIADVFATDWEIVS